APSIRSSSRQTSASASRRSSPSIATWPDAGTSTTVPGTAAVTCATRSMGRAAVETTFTGEVFTTEPIGTKRAAADHELEPTPRITGKHGEKGREILARELAEGFTVGSHSVTHPNLKHAVGEQLTREIDASIRTLAVQAGRPIGMFRPPYGALSPSGRVRLKK